MDVTVSQKVPTNAGYIPPAVIEFLGGVVRNSQLIALSPLEKILNRNAMRKRAVTARHSLSRLIPI
jgi:hypothetical protein